MMQKLKKIAIIGTITTSLFFGGMVSAAGLPLWYTNYLKGIATPSGSSARISTPTYGGGSKVPTTPTQPVATTPAPVSGETKLLQEETTLFNLLNQERQKRGLPVLKHNPGLVELARKKAKDMADFSYFSHTSPTYGKAVDMVRSAGISHSIVGENIAITASAARANTLFMGSSVHRSTRMNRNFTEVGIGMYRKANGSLYVAEFFIGTR